MDDDMIDLLDVAMRVVGLLDGPDRRLLARFWLQAPAAELGVAGPRGGAESARV